MMDEAIAARRRVLAATSISYAVVLLDTSIVNVALDSLSTAFGTHIAGLQWVVNAYTLMFASLLLTGGTLGDRWGARKVYLAGLIVFMLASSLCGMATALPVLVFARAIQGIGAAMLVPCSLKLIHHACPDPAQRARAIGIWVGLGGVAMAAGPLIGGLWVATAMAGGIGGRTVPSWQWAGTPAGARPVIHLAVIALAAAIAGALFTVATTGRWKNANPASNSEPYVHK